MTTRFPFVSSPCCHFISFAHVSLTRASPHLRGVDDGRLRAPPPALQQRPRPLLMQEHQRWRRLPRRPERQLHRQGGLPAGVHAAGAREAWAAVQREHADPQVLRRTVYPNHALSHSPTRDIMLCAVPVARQHVDTAPCRTWAAQCGASSRRAPPPTASSGRRTPRALVVSRSRAGM